MPILASIILRLMLDKQSLPSFDNLMIVILHMVKTEIGTYLASIILVEICDFCQCVSASKSPSANMIKPDVMIFNLVLDACARFESSFMGQQIMELMTQVRVVADAHTIVIIARIYEMNGQRDELNKFKNHIVHVPMSLVPHYQQFYESLLNLHFKFDDIDAASALILDIYKCRESLPFKQDKMSLELMTQVRVVADAHTIVIIARIYEMNGQRDELNKFKNHIVHVPMSLVPHYQQFYESLLNLHFKFDDIDAASALILDIYKCRESLPFKQDKMSLELMTQVRVVADAHTIVIIARIYEMNGQRDELNKFKNHIVHVPMSLQQSIAKLIIRYKKSGRIKEFSEVLSSIQNKLGSLGEASLCSDVVAACIHLGWLENAHDILEDLESARTPLASGSYSSLLTLYYRVKMFKEAEVLLKQIQKAGFHMKMFDEVVSLD
ncbi:unnamed protein product [Ilex paraguariensis]|uniref:Uncharacterized protein n=1 Tax=Ilex paraguariensis TaxID=185542 RepID=A0ABC8QNS1_9AQUA